MSEPSVVVVDAVVNEYRADIYGDEFTIQTEYVTFDGDTGTICLSASAIRDLAEKLHEAQQVMLFDVIDQSKGRAVTLRTGDTRGEVTLV